MKQARAARARSVEASADGRWTRWVAHRNRAKSCEVPSAACSGPSRPRSRFMQVSALRTPGAARHAVSTVGGMDIHEPPRPPHAAGTPASVDPRTQPSVLTALFSRLKEQDVRDLLDRVGQSHAVFEVRVEPLPSVSRGSVTGEASRTGPESTSDSRRSAATLGDKEAGPSSVDTDHGSSTDDRT
jgi:hypothetical protein